MGTIPAPNIVQDAGEIAAAPRNAMAEYARVAGLKAQTDAMQQQTQERTALAPINQQSEQLKLQQQQIATKDQAAGSAALHDPDFKTMDDLPGLIKKHGGSLNAYAGARDNVLAYNTKLQTFTKDQLGVEATKNDAIAGHIDTVKGLPPDQQPAAFENAKGDLVQRGYMTPQEAQGMAYPGPDGLDALEKLHQAHTAQVKEKIDQQEADTKQQEANAKDWQKDDALGVFYNTRTGVVKTPAGQAMSPGMMESKYVGLQQKKNAGQPLDASDAAWMKGYEKMKTLVPVANFNLQNNGAAADAGGNPSQIAQAIANGQMSWKDAVSPRTPMATKNAILSQVFKINPQFDTAEFGLETDVAKKARSGAWADTRLAYNTAIDHSKQLLSAIDALDNSDVKKLNSLRNFFRTEFGSPEVPTYDTIANAYNHETTSVISKGHITDKEVETGHAVLPDNAGPKQLRGAVGAYQQLMQSKRDELDKIIKVGAGNKANAILNTESNSSGAGGGDFFSKIGGKAR